MSSRFSKKPINLAINMTIPEIFVEKNMLACLMVINLIKTNKLYGVS